MLLFAVLLGAIYYFCCCYCYCCGLLSCWALFSVADVASAAVCCSVGAEWSLLLLLRSFALLGPVCCSLCYLCAVSCCALLVFAATAMVCCILLGAVCSYCCCYFCALSYWALFVVTVDAAATTAVRCLVVHLSWPLLCSTFWCRVWALVRR